MDRKLSALEAELLKKIEEHKKRFPYHSVQPYLIQELEELEEQLEEVRRKMRRKDSKST